MPTIMDLRSTLNLPKTDFPMKANLPQAEPRRLEQWKAEGLYGQVRKAREGASLLRPPRRPPLRQRPHPPGHRPQQDPEGRGGAQPVDGRQRRALRAGLGLPRPPHRAAGRPEPRPEEEGHVGGRLPPGLPRVRREVRADPARGVRAPGRAGRVGGPVPHHGSRATRPRSCGSSPASWRRASSTRPRSPSTGASPTARRWPRPRSSTTSSTPARRSTCASPLPESGAGQARGTSLRLWAERVGLGGHLDNDALDAARQPRPGLPSGRGLRVLSRLTARRTSWWWRRRWRSAPSKRWGLALGASPRRGQGRGVRRRPLPPSLDRPRLPGRARRLRHPRHRHRRRAHRPRPRLGRLPHRRALRPRHLLPGGRGGPLPARGGALRGQEGLRRQPRGRGLPAGQGRAPRERQGDALLPDLLALQEPDHLPRHRAVVHRPRRRGPAPRAGARGHPAR